MDKGPPLYPFYVGQIEMKNERIAFPLTPRIPEEAIFFMSSGSVVVRAFLSILEPYSQVLRYLHKNKINEYEKCTIFSSHENTNTYLKEWFGKKIKPPEILKDLGSLSKMFNASVRLFKTAGPKYVDGKLLDKSTNIILNEQLMTEIARSKERKCDYVFISDLIKKLVMLSEMMDNFWNAYNYMHLVLFYQYEILGRMLHSYKTDGAMVLHRKLVKCKNELFSYLEKQKIYPNFITHYTDGQTREDECAENAIIEKFWSQMDEPSATIFNTIAIASELIASFEPLVGMITLDIPSVNVNEISNDNARYSKTITISRKAEICNVSRSTIKNWEGTNGRPANPPDGYPRYSDEETFRDWADNDYKLRRKRLLLPGSIVNLNPSDAAAEREEFAEAFVVLGRNKEKNKLVQRMRDVVEKQLEMFDS